MTTGNHTATMTVQNWDNIFSGMMFDYAAINQTIVSPTTTASATSSTAASTTSSHTAAPSSNSTTNIGAIVGGVLGGLVALCAVLAIFYLRRRRRHKPQRLSMDLNAEPKTEPFFSADSLYQQPATTTAGPYTGVSGRLTTENLVTGAVSTLAPPQSTSSGSSRPEKSQLGITNPNQSASHVAAGTTTGTWAGSSSTYAPGSSDTSRARIQQTNAMLSDDQADFVNNLYANNVPAGAIARVIERMMAGEREPAVDGYGSLPPPSYNHAG
ncbi:hypothetical protein J3R82DRAFT_8247 [Butyriboletus roseoflavus]|nr:hypothetical protein J3R82DRAFT_8247 [Butyriboletus roseoflavus]